MWTSRSKDENNAANDDDDKGDVSVIAIQPYGVLQYNVVKNSLPKDHGRTYFKFNYICHLSHCEMLTYKPLTNNAE